MTPSRILLSALPILLAASGAAQAQSTIKPGLWESKIVRMTMDGKDALAQMNAAQEQMRQAFAKMPPEQRKKMEAMMPAQSGDSGTHRICISPEMVAKDGALVPRPQRAECDPPKVSKSGNRTSFEAVCKQVGGGQTVSKGEILIDGDLASSKIEAVSTDRAGARHTTQTETQMKFVSSNCGSVKPIDQLMSDLKAQAGAMSGAAPAKK